MDIRYERQINRSFMVITDSAVINPLEDEMLRENKIRMLLPFFTMERDGENEFWYDITGSISLYELSEKGSFDTKELIRFLKLLGIVFDELSKYLISPDHLYLTAETIFLSKDEEGFLPGLCYFPGEDISMQKMLSDLISCFSARDKTVVSLYDCAIREDFSYNKLLDIAEGFYAGNEKETYEVPSFLNSEHDLREDVKTPYVEEIYISDVNDMGDGAVSFFDGIKEWFLEHSHSKGKKKEKIKKTIKKKKDSPEDLIIDPFIEISEPTVLLSGADKSSGKLLYEGKGDEDDIEIRTDITRIGKKGHDNDAILHSVSVSRHHAKIIREGASFYILDLNSTNGTFINDELLSVNEKTLLKPMDRVRFADVSYRFV